jgi:colanic acid/amylovoran biosynthesis glycosyltransferase
MTVLHVLDRYLNQTMNWVHRLMVHTPCEHVVSAEVHFRNAFKGENISFTKSLIQTCLPEGRDEWHPGWPQRVYGPLLRGYHIRHLQKEIHRQDIDVIHFHFATVAARYLPLIENTDIPVIVSFYGYDYQKAISDKPGLFEKYKRLFDLVSTFIVEGRAGRDTLVELGCPIEKIRILHLGIGIANRPLEEKTKPKGRLRLIQPATFTPKKGQDLSIKALDHLTHLDDLELTLMGEEVDQDYSEKLKALAQESRARVTFEPFVDYADFYRKLKDHDIIIQPSRHAPDGDSEGGAPVTLIDAQYCGLPVISTYHCDIPEVVIHGQTGMLVEEEDVDGLSKMIVFYYNMTNEEFQGWRKRGHEHIGQHYDIKKSGIHLMEIYKAVK